VSSTHENAQVGRAVFGWKQSIKY